MLMLGGSAHAFVEEKSNEFQKEFLALLRRAHPNQRVFANEVYQEYIADKLHIHMNATKWVTLTEFVEHLGRLGVVKAEPSERGYYIRLVVDDAFKGLQVRFVGALEGVGPHVQPSCPHRVTHTHTLTLTYHQASAARAEREEAHEARRHRLLMEQVQRATAAAEAQGTDPTLPTGSALVRTEDDQPIRVGGLVASTLGIKRRRADTLGGAFHDDDDDDDDKDRKKSHSHATTTTTTSTYAALAVSEEAAKAAKAHVTRPDRPSDPPGSSSEPTVKSKSKSKSEVPKTWLVEGIWVKITSRGLRGTEFYHAKGVVVGTKGRVGEVSVGSDGDVVAVDERELETVIPKEGGSVIIVGGMYRGKRGVLRRIKTEKYVGEVEVEGVGVVTLDYEEFSKREEKEEGGGARR